MHPGQVHIEIKKILFQSHIIESVYIRFTILTNKQIPKMVIEKIKYNETEKLQLCKKLKSLPKDEIN